MTQSNDEGQQYLDAIESLQEIKRRYLEMEEALKVLITHNLSHAWTEEGVTRWWLRDQKVLGDRCPMKVFQDGDFKEVVSFLMASQEMTGS